MPINLKDHIRTVPDFPKEGILFYDIGTLLANGPAWQEAINQMMPLIKAEKPDYIMAIEARGFLFGAALAAQMGIGMIMVRKKGKLAGETAEYSYELEYGTDTLQVQKGIIPTGKKAVLVDDLLATGGTAEATLELSKQIELTITRAIFLAELTFLKGRERLNVPVTSLLAYDE